MDKINFIRNEFPKMLQQLDPHAKGIWGVMNAQQMVEHMSDMFRNANGKLKIPLHTPADKVGAFKAFAMSDKEFKQNTNNPLLPETPDPIKNSSMQASISELQSEVNDFFSFFEKNPSKSGSPCSTSMWCIIANNLGFLNRN
jgi:hypothetical protein